jgi:hypothetical protein
MKIDNRLFFLLCLTLAYCLCACNGPRNIYSVSSLLPPVPLQKGASGIDVGYSTHQKTTNYKDSAGNKDYAFSLTLSHMLNKKTMLLAYTDVKNEKNIYTTNLDSLHKLIYNAGFDSSVVYGKRYTAGLGIAYLLKTTGMVIPSVAGSISLHQMSLREAGTLKGNPYHRFYKMNQLSFSLQGNLLFKFGKRFNLAYINRLTIVQLFKANTDYSADEQYNAGLHQAGKMKVLLCPIALYADFQPIKKIPLSLTGQFFSDYVNWNRMMSEYEPGRTYVKGTGVAVGLRYVVK